MKKRPEFVSIGYISKAHGVRGEVIVIPITDDPEQFLEPMEFFLLKKDNSRDKIKFERVRERNGKFIIKLLQIDDRNAAETLHGCYIQRRMEKTPTLEDDEFYIFDLIGLCVKTIDGRYIGEITDVLTMPANDVYVVRANSREILIPAIKDVVKKVDLENELVLIEPMDGLL